VWNPVVPKDTLVILPLASWIFGQASATVGYFPDSADNQPGRHSMIIGVTGTQTLNWATTIAHELGMLILFDCKIKTDNAGHVFGLLHEHQRQDRDQYVYFDCTRIRGYRDLNSRLEYMWNVPDMGTLCNDKDLSWYYDFPAYEFSTQPDMNQGPQGPVPWTTEKSPRYDINSIMHYTTQDYAVHTDYQSNNFHGPLLAWKNGGPGFVPPHAPTLDDFKVINRNLRPSSLDCDAIRRLYPWTT
jgi:hypothetical protein